MVKCPKEPKVDLEPGTLPGELTGQCCSDCDGVWIRPEHYAEWQASQGVLPDQEIQVAVVPSQLPTTFQPSSLDNRAALCPDCQHYLARGRVQLQDTSFFVERCPNCKGYWCDRGEWDILQQLQLDKHLDYIFSDAWQTQVKALEFVARERKAIIEKLGPDIASKIFELADLLENHPNGDFGVAYLMRRFDE
ncbi:zf-TFIIB domain-containing protein [Oscillatoria sp. CS-180]|uniref:zf-TFIIB domain-containing protein n=1 Tax=Oscillatoria sp. CS-180 TaxID=3021720 RepID=UPI00232AE37B|nr:zf-TFIIB domain-containing protein [Oscillatoria sp. CS-180]MDB9529794.1 zf-TFIIB domain-containing protein [Oscillatoria sp. CS-180]